MADGAPGLRGPSGAAAAASAAPSLRPGGWPARPSLPSFPSRRWGGGLRGLTGASEAGVAPGREPAAAVGPGAGCVCVGEGFLKPSLEPGCPRGDGGRGSAPQEERGSWAAGRPRSSVPRMAPVCVWGGCRYPELLCGKKEQKRPTRSFKHSFSGWYRFHERQLVICMGSYSPGARGLVTVAVATPPLPRSRST